MPNVELSNEQVIALINQMPLEHKLSLWQSVATDAQRLRDERMREAENKMRALCAERGVDWDAMDDEQRLSFVDDLIHEDRQLS